MGYGFVEFDSQSRFTQDSQSLYGTMVDGRTLELQSCPSKGQESGENPSLIKSGRTLLGHGRNVPFEPTRTELLKHLARSFS
jgi:hypothetical protein